jgi:hypothetical protein
MAVWLHNKYVVASLVVIILGHWSLILQGMGGPPAIHSNMNYFLFLFLFFLAVGVLLSTVWTPSGCVVRGAETRVLAATFIYSMAFDAIVLGLMAGRFWMMAYGWAGGAGHKDIEMGKRAAAAATSSCRTKGKSAETADATDVVMHVPLGGPGRLGRLVFGDGLIYFIIS